MSSKCHWKVSRSVIFNIIIILKPKYFLKNTNFLKMYTLSHKSYEHTRYIYTRSYSKQHTYSFPIDRNNRVYMFRTPNLKFNNIRMYPVNRKLVYAAFVYTCVVVENHLISFAFHPIAYEMRYIRNIKKKLVHISANRVAFRLPVVSHHVLLRVVGTKPYVPHIVRRVTYASRVRQINQTPLNVSFYSFVCCRFNERHKNVTDNRYVKFFSSGYPSTSVAGHGHRVTVTTPMTIQST